jgi:hypothetical protein
MNRFDDVPIDESSDAYQQLIGQTPAAFVLKTYTVATVPDASMWVRGLIYVSDETGGATVAFSDGTNWRRVQDRAIVS